MDGQTNGLTLIRERALDRLFDPPSGVGRKLAALARVEAFDGLDQPDVALADEVEEGKTKVFIVHRDLHDEAQVRLDHVIASRLVAAADALRERNLLVD